MLTTIGYAQVIAVQVPRKKVAPNAEHTPSYRETESHRSYNVDTQHEDDKDLEEQPQTVNLQEV
jgi:hypothetical protein